VLEKRRFDKRRTACRGEKKVKKTWSIVWTGLARAKTKIRENKKHLPGLLAWKGRKFYRKQGGGKDWEGQLARTKRKSEMTRKQAKRFFITQAFPCQSELTKIYV